MTDKPAAFQAYLPPGAWPYWPLTPMRGAPTPDGDPWSSAGALTAAVANAGLLGNLGAPQADSSAASQGLLRMRQALRRPLSVVP